MLPNSPARSRLPYTGFVRTISKVPHGIFRFELIPDNVRIVGNWEVNFRLARDPGVSAIDSDKPT